MKVNASAWKALQIERLTSHEGKIRVKARLNSRSNLSLSISSAGKNQIFNRNLVMPSDSLCDFSLSLWAYAPDGPFVICTHTHTHTLTRAWGDKSSASSRFFFFRCCFFNMNFSWGMYAELSKNFGFLSLEGWKLNCFVGYFGQMFILKHVFEKYKVSRTFRGILKFWRRKYTFIMLIEFKIFINNKVHQVFEILTNCKSLN